MSEKEKTGVPNNPQKVGCAPLLRGFMLMDPTKRLEICRKGGANVPREKRAYSTNRELASRSGQKGGKMVDPTKRIFSKDRKFAAECGRKSRKRKKSDNISITVHTIVDND